MPLAKLIQEPQIQKTYQPFVDAAILILRDSFHSGLHSIYMCGSIPKGIATPHSSDADFTVALHSSVTNETRSDLEKVKSKLLENFPFIVKIDMHCCSVDEVLSNPLGWGFWISIVSVCIHGEDLGARLPPLYPNHDLITEINSDTLKTLDSLHKRAEAATDPDLVRRIRKKLARRYLMALFSLVMQQENFWTDDINLMKTSLEKHFPKQKVLIATLFHQATAPSDPTTELLRNFEDVKAWFNRLFKAFSG